MRAASSATASPATTRPTSAVAPPYPALMGRAAVAVGLAVLLLTHASQSGLLGAHDFAAIALIGLLGALFCTFAAVTSRSRAAVGGILLSVLPVVLLIYYLNTSND